MSEQPTAWCCKCKARQPVKDVQQATAKNGRRFERGVCSVCGTRTSKMVG